jgi:hypothetical protein
MRLWYDPSGGAHGINTANWFAEHVGLVYPTDCTFHEIPPPQQIAQLLPQTPGLLELLPIIRHGRADLIVQADENDENWEENQIILVTEVTAEAPHGHNFYQRAEKFVPSASLGIPTAYILPQSKVVAGAIYRPQSYQRSVFGMLHHRYDTPVMHVGWPSTDQGELLIDPTLAWQPAAGYQGEPLVGGEVQTFINQCINYLVNGQPMNQAFAGAIATNQADFITYLNEHERGNGWAAHHNIQVTAATNVGAGAHADVLARQSTLVLGPSALGSPGANFMRIDPYTGTLLWAEEWISRLLDGPLEHNTVYEANNGSIVTWNGVIDDYIDVHDENAECPFHNLAVFTPQTAAEHMLEQDPCCPFNNAYRHSKWLTMPHAVIFPDGVWVSPYRR